MKKKSFQPVRNTLRFLILVAIFLVNLIIVDSCMRDRLKIDRTKPAGGKGTGDKYSVAPVLPPRPDTHVVARSAFMNYSEMEVDYNALSDSIENGAHLMGSNDEILSTAKVESLGNPEMVSNKPVYHMRAVFQLDKTADQSMLKVTLPNSASVPDNGSETFIIKIQ